MTSTKYLEKYLIKMCNSQDYFCHSPFLQAPEHCGYTEPWNPIQSCGLCGRSIACAQVSAGFIAFITDFFCQLHDIFFFYSRWNGVTRVRSDQICELGLSLQNKRLKGHNNT